MLDWLLDTVPWWDLLVLVLVGGAAWAGWNGGLKHAADSAHWFLAFAVTLALVVFAVEECAELSRLRPELARMGLGRMLWHVLRESGRHTWLFLCSYLRGFAAGLPGSLPAAGMALALGAAWVLTVVGRRVSVLFFGWRRSTVRALVDRTVGWLSGKVPPRTASVCTAAWCGAWRLAAAGFCVAAVRDGIRAVLDAARAELPAKALAGPGTAFLDNLASDLAASPVARVGESLARAVVALLTGRAGP
ncbi:MAG: hypothetical protein AB1609_14660 [Bacillota bacterium]